MKSQEQSRNGRTTTDAVRAAMASTAREREAYRDLLRSEWNLTDLVRALDIAEVLLRRAGFALPVQADGGQTVEPVAPALYPVPSVDSEVVEYIERLNDAVLGASSSRPPRRTKPERAELSRLVQRMVLVLAFPDLLKPRPLISGDVGFFKDLQGLIFQLSLHELVPALKTNRMQSELSRSLRFLLAHAFNVLQTNPGYGAYLRAQVLDEIGDAAGAARFLELAWSSCPREAHEYMTIAQALWSHLADRDVGIACDFALALHRRVLPRDVDEARELVDLSYQMLGEQTARTA